MKELRSELGVINSRTAKWEKPMNELIRRVDLLEVHGSTVAHSVPTTPATVRCHHRPSPLSFTPLPSTPVLAASQKPPESRKRSLNIRLEPEESNNINQHENNNENEVSEFPPSPPPGVPPTTTAVPPTPTALIATELPTTPIATQPAKLCRFFVRNGKLPVIGVRALQRPRTSGPAVRQQLLRDKNLPPSETVVFGSITLPAAEYHNIKKHSIYSFICTFGRYFFSPPELATGSIRGGKSTRGIEYAALDENRLALLFTHTASSYPTEFNCKTAQITNPLERRNALLGPSTSAALIKLNHMFRNHFKLLTESEIETLKTTKILNYYHHLNDIVYTRLHHIS